MVTHDGAAKDVHAGRGAARTLEGSQRQPASSSPTPALVYLIGAGPGDPGLITEKGLAALREADVVIYDYLSSDELLAQARDDAELIFVGKKGFASHVTQEQINQLLVDCATRLGERYAANGGDPADGRMEGARRRPTIARLKGGDPYVFGRGGEEGLYLAEHDVPFEVVPGVTSGIAAPAYAGIPVTHRKVASSVTFVTGHEDPTRTESSIQWDALASLAARGNTLCLYMGIRNLPTITSRLSEAGLAADTPVALVRWGTLPAQETLVSTLGQVAADAQAARFEAPAIIVVGQVVTLRERLSWFESLPLFGRRIVVTRSRAQAGTLSRLLAELGAQAIEFPTIEQADPDDPSALGGAIERLSAYDWLVFTSANGVERFFARLAGHEPALDARALASSRVAAIGPATAAALRAHGIAADVVPGEYRAEAVFAALEQACAEDGGLEGQRVLIPRAQVARETLPELLAQAGAEVTVAPAYKTVAPSPERMAELAGRIKAGEVDAITFTSSSTARNLVAALGGAEKTRELLADVDLFSIGPVTSATLEEAGLAVAAQAKRYTIGGLVDCIKEAYA